MFKNIFSRIRKGIVLMKQDRYDEAIEYFNGLVSKRKFLAEAHFNLGRCYFKLGNYEQSKKNLLQTLNFNLSTLLVKSILEITNWRNICSDQCYNSLPSFSPCSKKIVFVSARKDTNGDGRIDSSDCGGVYIIDIETGLEYYIVSDEFYNLSPIFSPDGKKLAYLSARGQGNAIVNNNSPQGLFLLDLETETEIQILDDTYKIKRFIFTNNGKKIIFCGWRPEEKNSGIFALNLETGEVDTLVPGYYENTFPSIAPSGNRLIYTSWRRDTNNDGFIDLHDNTGIYMKNLLIETETVIAGDKYNNTFPMFSPDGNKILYLSVRRDTNRDGIIDSTDNAGIYIYDLENKKEICVVSDISFNKFPSFTPDSNKIVFISNWRINRIKHDRLDFFENKGVYAINTDGSKINQLVSDKYYGCRFPVVSPNGEFVAYSSWRKNTNRGLYLAYLNKLPTKEELRDWIENNLHE